MKGLGVFPGSYFIGLVSGAKRVGIAELMWLSHAYFKKISCCGTRSIRYAKGIQKMKGVFP